MRYNGGDFITLVIVIISMFCLITGLLSGGVFY